MLFRPLLSWVLCVTFGLQLVLGSHLASADDLLIPADLQIELARSIVVELQERQRIEQGLNPESDEKKLERHARMRELQDQVYEEIQKNSGSLRHGPLQIKIKYLNGLFYAGTLSTLFAGIGAISAFGQYLWSQVFDVLVASLYFPVVMVGSAVIHVKWETQAVQAARQKLFSTQLGPFFGELATLGFTLTPESIDGFMRELTEGKVTSSCAELLQPARLGPGRWMDESHGPELAAPIEVKVVGPNHWRDDS